MDTNVLIKKKKKKKKARGFRVELPRNWEGTSFCHCIKAFYQL